MTEKFREALLRAWCKYRNMEYVEGYVKPLPSDNFEKGFIAGAAVSDKLNWFDARNLRPNHMQVCYCYDKFMGGGRVYVYDDISKYWCTANTTDHDPDGDNHVCDYADFRERGSGSCIR